jgi:hypothetical protein
LKEVAVVFQAETAGIFKLQDSKDAIGGEEEALKEWIEGAKTKEAALMEREIELRKLQDTLEQNRQDCQAWEDRLRMLESHLHEREGNIKEREQALEKALQHLRVIPNNPQEKMSAPDEDRVAPSSPYRVPSSIALIDNENKPRGSPTPLPTSPENAGTNFENLQVSSGPAQAVDGSSTSMSQVGGEMGLSASTGPRHSANGVEDIKLREERFSLMSMAHSMTSSVVPSIRSSTDDGANRLQSAGISEPTIKHTAFSRRQLYVLSRHTLQWRDLDTMKFLTWNDIPWPTFIDEARPEEVTKEEVRLYFRLLRVFEHRISDPKGLADRLKDVNDFMVEYIARWHPDRLEVRVFRRVVERDKEVVHMFANKVVAILQEIHAQVDGLGGM